MLPLSPTSLWIGPVLLTLSSRLFLFLGDSTDSEAFAWMFTYRSQTCIDSPVPHWTQLHIWLRSPQKLSLLEFTNPTDPKEDLHSLSVSLIVLRRLILFALCLLQPLNSRIDTVFIKWCSFSSSCLTWEWGRRRRAGELSDAPPVSLRMSDKPGQKKNIPSYL